jgi:hypothetical protein
MDGITVITRRIEKTIRTTIASDMERREHDAALLALDDARRRIGGAGMTGSMICEIMRHRFGRRYTATTIGAYIARARKSQARRK